MIKTPFGMKKVVTELLARHKKTLANLEQAEYFVFSTARNESQRITELQMERGEGAGIMDLHLAYRGDYLGGGDCGRSVFSVAHYYSQNGDLMDDPFMEFIEEGIDWRPAHFNQHSPPYSVQSAFCRDRGVFIHPRHQKENRSFARKWASNIKKQGFLHSTLYDRSGKRISYIDARGRCRKNDGTLCPKITR